MTPRSSGNSPNNKITASGYMKIRWYQQSTQGCSPITSLKNKLPSSAVIAINQQTNNKNQPEFTAKPD